MLKKLTVILAISLVLLLGGCIRPYKPTIQQGNIITQEMVDKLKPGMTQDQVQFIMGTPVLVETFDTKRWDYVYTIKPGYGKMSKDHVTLHFENERLASIDGTIRPGITTPKKITN